MYMGLGNPVLMRTPLKSIYMVTAIRIEDEFGIGWNRTGCNVNDILDLICKLGLIPYYSVDNIDLHKEGREWFFAYTSLEVLQNYLDNSHDFKRLAKFGFRFYEIVICPYCIQKGSSGHQLAFHERGIKSKKDITEILTIH